MRASVVCTACHFSTGLSEGLGRDLPDVILCSIRFGGLTTSTLCGDHDGARSKTAGRDICSSMQVGERFLSLTNYRTLSTMPALKSYLWWAMPPTAFLSLASLLTYLVFRLVYLATAEQVQRNHSEDATFNRLRTLALPWIFFVFELIILRKLPSHSSSLSIYVTRH